jgi:hypothetical protein
MSADITIDGWRRQRQIYLAENLGQPLDLGFAAFYLNRTNRSGIIKGAGVIGGLEQSGSYKERTVQASMFDVVSREIEISHAVIGWYPSVPLAARCTWLRTHLTP